MEVNKCINTHGATKTAETLDAIKSLGYKYSTRAAMTVSILPASPVSGNKYQVPYPEKEPQPGRHPTALASSKGNGN